MGGGYASRKNFINMGTDVELLSRANLIVMFVGLLLQKWLSKYSIVILMQN